MAHFSKVAQEPEDPIYGLQVSFKKDTRPDKINLSIGVFPKDPTSSFRFSAVDAAEKILAEKKLSKDYLPIDGLVAFCNHTTDLVLGNDRSHPSLTSYTAQTVGGTAALHIGAKFLLQNGVRKIFISDPTWVNHRRLFEACGLEVLNYPYEITKAGTVDLKKMLTAIQNMPENSCIVLQASCHNPTGIDPTDADWQTLSDAIRAKKLIPFFDMAYQGIGRGLDQDAASIRLFLKNNHEMLIASSFSKNFGLYSDRVGALTITCEPASVSPISSQIRKIIRSIYSSPPAHGAHIVNTILSSDELSLLWKDELATLRKKLHDSREAIHLIVEKNNKMGSFEQLMKSTGLFCMCNISREKVLELRKEKGLYLCDDGRINIAAVRPELVQFIADSIL